MRIMQAYLITFSQSRTFCCLKHPLIQLLVCFVLLFLAALCSASLESWLFWALCSDDIAVDTDLTPLYLDMFCWLHTAATDDSGCIFMTGFCSWQDNIYYTYMDGVCGSISISSLELNPKNIRSNPSTLTWYCKYCRGSLKSKCTWLAKRKGTNKKKNMDHTFHQSHLFLC